MRAMSVLFTVVVILVTIIMMIMMIVFDYSNYHDDDDDANGAAAGGGGVAGFMTNIQNVRVSIQLAQQAYGGHEVRQPR